MENGNTKELFSYHENNSEEYIRLSEEFYKDKEDDYLYILAKRINDSGQMPDEATVQKIYFIFLKADPYGSHCTKLKNLINGPEINLTESQKAELINHFISLDYYPSKVESLTFLGGALSETTAKKIYERLHQKLNEFSGPKDFVVQQTREEILSFSKIIETLSGVNAQFLQDSIEYV